MALVRAAWAAYARCRWVLATLVVRVRVSPVGIARWVWWGWVGACVSMLVSFVESMLPRGCGWGLGWFSLVRWCVVGQQIELLILLAWSTPPLCALPGCHRSCARCDPACAILRGTYIRSPVSWRCVDRGPCCWCGLANGWPVRCEAAGGERRLARSHRLEWAPMYSCCMWVWAARMRCICGCGAWCLFERLCSRSREWCSARWRLVVCADRAPGGRRVFWSGAMVLAARNCLTRAWERSPYIHPLQISWANYSAQSGSNDAYLTRKRNELSIPAIVTVVVSREH